MLAETPLKGAVEAPRSGFAAPSGPAKGFNEAVAAIWLKRCCRACVEKLLAFGDLCECVELRAPVRAFQSPAAHAYMACCGNSGAAWLTSGGRAEFWANYAARGITFVKASIGSEGGAMLASFCCVCICAVLEYTAWGLSLIHI